MEPCIPLLAVASKASHHAHVHPTKPLETRERPRGIPIEKLGWTKEKTQEARRRLASFLADWEGPSMDVYDMDPQTR